MGTRASALARTQSGQFAELLTKATGVPVETVLVRTEGDQLSVEGKVPPGGDTVGVFTKALDDALREGRIDFAVHSLKDLPTAIDSDLFLGAVPLRADVRDALVVASRHAGIDSIAGLPHGARIATSSPRRIAQLLNQRPDLAAVSLQGNVDTRLRRLEEGVADALLLACAGLDRLGLSSRISRRLPPEEMLSAPGQGALAAVCLANARDVKEVLASQDDPSAHATAEAERAFLNHLRGGCRAPVGARAETRDGDGLFLRVIVLSLDGTSRLDGERTGVMANPEGLGRELAEDLLGRGAAELVTAARNPRA
jgi:hydroxymethylbilane synthase